MGQKGEGNSLRYFTTTTFNYPTMAEAYRVAALNGLNRLDPCDVRAFVRSQPPVADAPA
jgi:hypothetical protein